MGPKNQPVGQRDAHQHPLPHLPRLLEDPRPVLLLGILLWLAGAVALFVLHPQRGMDSAVWTCVIGVIAGGCGWFVYAWQRAAVRRGAQWVQDNVPAGGDAGPDSSLSSE